jgi:hypothetical protein
MNTARRYWYISISITLIFSVLLLSLWISMNNYELNDPQLVNEGEAIEEINKYLNSSSYSATLKAAEQVHTIRVGVYLQSLQFFDSNDVNVSGYIWQKYTCDPLTEPLSRAIYLPIATVRV